MSYCRWSTNNFQCDAYVYESDDGWVLELAAKRYQDDGTIVEIGLPYDGQSFLFSHPIECAIKLLEMKLVGYWIPQYAITDLIEEGWEMIE
jgi:hypothetical protein